MNKKSKTSSNRNLNIKNLGTRTSRKTNGISQAGMKDQNLILNQAKQLESRSLSKGFVSVLVLLIVFTLLFLGIYFISFSLVESRISKNQTLAGQAYYLAEAGINEAIWKLKNDESALDGDAAWKVKFMTQPDCETFTDSFTRAGNLFSNGSYTVDIKNSECARGQIISRATFSLSNGKTIQRVVKTAVFKALNPSLIGDSAVFTGGTSEVVTINGSIVNINKGNFFSNNNINISGGSIITINDDPDTADLEGKILAVQNINKSPSSTLTATAKCSKDTCEGACDKCPPDSISMPMIDFDSAEATSYKSKAQSLQDSGQCSVLCNGVQCSTDCIFSDSDFQNLLWNIGEGGTLTLNNDVTYVTGNSGIELKGGVSLVVNGVLAVDSGVDIGTNSCWVKSGTKHCGMSKITINHTDGKPSGLLTKSKINGGDSAAEVNIVGLLYANDELKLMSLPQSFNITGGMMARKISLMSIWQAINITFDEAIVTEALGSPVYSPIVTIEHWEETY